MTEIDISKIDKAEVLLTLYNNSQPLGLGFLQYEDRKMTLSEAKELLQNQTYFDYLKGRVMKIDLGENILKTWLYDRDNGENAAYNVLKNANLI
jgi:hypothetical protein